LGISVKRRLFATIPWIVLVVYLLMVLNIMSWGFTVGVPVLIVIGFANYTFFERIIVHERRGFCCKECGYDLQGQTEAYCPECGRSLDDDEKRMMALTDPGGVVEPVPSASRFRLLLVIVVIALLILAVAGHAVHLYMLRQSRLSGAQGTSPSQPLQNSDQSSSAQPADP